MIRLAHIFQILCLLIISNSILCQDYTWLGGVGSWNDPQKWYPSGVPQMSDDVYIAKGTVHIPTGYVANATFVEIHKSGGINIHANSSLEVVGNSGNQGILNYGVVETSGSVKSNGHTGGLFVGVGFRNFGKFYIYSGGSYSSTACGGYALYNEQYAICSNEGAIDILNNGSGIRNHGAFKNLKSIHVNELVTSHGITNHGSFSNESGSSIRIEGNNEFGIVSSQGSNVSQTPEFVNNGKINVRESSWWCLILGHGTFINLAKGSISLTESENAGLVVDGVSIFENFGYVVSSSNSTDGIRGIGNLINRGFIISTSNGENGLNFSDIWTPEIGSIVNYGDIELYNNANHDIQLEVELHNTDEGYIYSENSIEGIEIVNDGIFSTIYNGIHNVTFENNGVVEDVNNSLPNIQNNQIVIRPLNGPLVANVVFFNALDKVSSSNTTISFGWYNQLANGNAAALYFSGTNSIYPNSFGATAPTMWMDATIKSSGLKRRLRVNILNATLPFTQSEEFNPFTNLSPNKSPEISIHPNPVVDALSIHNSEWHEGPYLFKLYDTSGNEIFSVRVMEFNTIDLPYAVKDGIYVGVVLNKDQILCREKLVIARGNLFGGHY